MRAIAFFKFFSIATLFFAVIPLVAYGASDATFQSPIVTLSHHVTVSGAAWSPDGARILSWGNAPADCPKNCLYQVYLWNVAEKATPRIIEHSSPISGARWSPDGTHILTWSGDAANVWSVQDGSQRHIFRHDAAINGASWSPDGTHILTWSADTTARVWSVNDAAHPIVLRQNPDGWEYPVLRAIWTPDGRQVVGLIGGADYIGETVFVWTVGEDKPLRLRHELWVNGLIGSADGKQVLTWSGDHTARLWSLDGSAAPIIFKHEAQVYHAAWNGSDTVLVTVDEYGYIREWTWNRNASPQATVLNHPGGAFGVSASPTYPAFATFPAGASDRYEVRVWGFGRYPVEPIGLPHDSTIEAVVWSHHTTLLTWTDDGTVQVYNNLWDMFATPAAVLRHTTPIGGAVWDADAKRILTWSGSEVYVWSAP